MPVFETAIVHRLLSSGNNFCVILKPVLSAFYKYIFLLIYCFTGTVYLLLKTVAILISLGLSNFACF